MKDHLRRDCVTAESRADGVNVPAEPNSVVRWLTAVANNRRNTERARGAAIALVDEWEGLEPSAGVALPAEPNKENAHG